MLPDVIHMPELTATGPLPNTYNWKDTKPPLSAWALWAVYEATNDISFVRELLPRVELYHKWWYAYRDVDKDMLCEFGGTAEDNLVYAKWESGMDNAPRFDNIHYLASTNISGAAAYVCNMIGPDLNAYLYQEKVSGMNGCDCHHWSPYHNQAPARVSPALPGSLA